jgi:hypothetical protein
MRDAPPDPICQRQRRLAPDLSERGGDLSEKTGATLETEESDGEQIRHGLWSEEALGDIDKTMGIEVETEEVMLDDCELRVRRHRKS